MKKIIKLQDLDCAVCADKMERAVKQINGVNSVNVNFMLQKMTLDICDGDETRILSEVKAVCKKIEPDCILKI